MTIYSAGIVTVSLKLLLHTHFVNGILVASILLSIFGYVAISALDGAILFSLDGAQPPRPSVRDHARPAPVAVLTWRRAAARQAPACTW